MLQCFVASLVSLIARADQRSQHVRHASSELLRNHRAQTVNALSFREAIAEHVLTSKFIKQNWQPSAPKCNALWVFLHSPGLYQKPDFSNWHKLVWSHSKARPPWFVNPVKLTPYIDFTYTQSPCTALSGYVTKSGGEALEFPCPAFISHRVIK